MNNTLIKRSIYFDLLRIFATFCVILLHTAAFKWNSVDIKSFEWNVLNVYDSIVRFTVPIFVMISGALLLNKERGIKDILKKNVLRIVTAFVFWSFIYSIVKYLTGKKIKDLIPFFINGNYHLWFLYMIAGLYLITPFLRKIVESRVLTKYFLYLSMIMSIGLYYIIQIISIFYPSAGEFIQKLVDGFYLDFVFGYTIYYVLGYYLDKYEIDKKSLYIIIFLGLLGYIMTILLTLITSLYTNTHYTGFYKYFALNVWLQSIFVFSTFKVLFKDKVFSQKITKIIYSLSKYSFGIYLVHALILDLFNMKLKINALSFNPIISVPVLAIVVFLISLIISAIINHIPMLRKYIV